MQNLIKEEQTGLERLVPETKRKPYAASRRTRRDARRGGIEKQIRGRGGRGMWGQGRGAKKKRKGREIQKQKRQRNDVWRGASRGGRGETYLKKQKEVMKVMRERSQHGICARETKKKTASSRKRATESWQKR